MNFLKIFSDSFQDNWNAPAVTSLDTGLTLDYSSLAARFARIHTFMKQVGVQQGTRVAISGKNSIDWVTIYMSIITYGAVVVVIPPNFTADDNITFAGMVECEYMFVDRDEWNDDIDTSFAPTLKLIVSMDATEILMQGTGIQVDTRQVLDRLDLTFVEQYPLGFQSANTVSPVVAPDDVVAIFFTAGTTGTPKAVMLSADSIEGNIIFGIKKAFHPRATHTLSLLPFSNIWGCVYDMMTSLASGAHLFIGPEYAPTNDTITAFKHVKPRRVLVSPDLIHCLYHLSEQHIEEKPFWQFIGKIPLLKGLRKIVVRRSFKKQLGGKCVEAVVGGSMVSPQTARTLHKARVRFTQVYGLIEVGGIITYTPASQWRPDSAGKFAGTLTQGRIRQLDIPGLPPRVGELQIKGMTIMKGYYGDDALTAQVLDADGWLSTGDIASISPQGIIKIYGRLDSLIQTPDGNVIFPEKIEMMLIDQRCIKNVVLVDRDGVLTAIVEPDGDYMKSHDILPDDVPNVIGHAIQEVNRLTRLHERIMDTEISPTPLLLTAKRTVRRYEYS